jgi:nucleoside 2-deoxyribosyltransferase
MIEKCLITGLPTIPYHDDRDGVIQYGINYKGKKFYFSFSIYTEHWSNNVSDSDKKTTVDYILEYIGNIKHILCGLIYNNKWPKEKIILDKWTIDKIIQEADYPHTPKEKLDNLILTLFKMQGYDGEAIPVDGLIHEGSEFIAKLYFKSEWECRLYLETLGERDFINTHSTEGIIDEIYFKYNGLEEAIKLTEEGQLSNNCFIAMSFDKEEDSIFFEAIKPACDNTGFIAKRIDYEHYDSEKTINDAIISLLKQCKFCIADFTQQKDGVYFEAGYALGRGLKVIYTCREDYFKKSHFDTNHFPHIVYKTNEELKKKLIDKINAYVKD